MGWWIVSNNKSIKYQNYQDLSPIDYWNEVNIQRLTWLSQNPDHKLIKNECQNLKIWLWNSTPVSMTISGIKISAVEELQNISQSSIPEMARLQNQLQEVIRARGTNVINSIV